MTTVQTDALRAMGQAGAVRVGERWIWREEVRTSVADATAVRRAIWGAACDRCGQRDGTVLEEVDEREDRETGYRDTRRLCAGCAKEE